MKINDFNTAYQWASARCARRETCRRDIESKLRETDLAPAVVEEVLERLESEGFIDHARFARAFVHDKLEYDRWGRLKIAQALRLKGIDRSEIAIAMDETIDEKQYADILRRLLIAKQRTLRFDPGDEREAYVASQKLLRFAVSRGFESHLVFNAIEHLSEE